MVKGISQKHRAWIIWETGTRSAVTLSAKANIPERTARSYVADFKAGKTWERKPYAPRANTKNVSKVRKEVFRKAQCRTKIYSSRDIGAVVGASHTTVQRILKYNGISYQSYSKRLSLTKERREKRVKFARFMQKRKKEWRFTIITDEASFWLNKSKPGKVWTADPAKETGAGVHGPKIHCWGGISARGALKLEIFEENLDADGYLSILRKKIPEIRSLYGDEWQWQQDGSGVHRAKVVTSFLAQNVPQKMNWPPYSPDLSPIENIWAWLKGQVAKDVPQSVDTLKKSIRRHWESMDIEFLAPYFDSMPKRMAMVIENEGFKINY